MTTFQHWICFLGFFVCRQRHLECFSTENLSVPICFPVNIICPCWESDRNSMGKVRLPTGEAGERSTWTGAPEISRDNSFVSHGRSAELPGMEIQLGNGWSMDLAPHPAHVGTWSIDHNRRLDPNEIVESLTRETLHTFFRPIQAALDISRSDAVADCCWLSSVSHLHHLYAEMQFRYVRST